MRRTLLAAARPGREAAGRRRAAGSAAQPGPRRGCGGDAVRHGLPWSRQVSAGPEGDRAPNGVVCAAREAAPSGGAAPCVCAGPGVRDDLLPAPRPAFPWGKGTSCSRGLLLRAQLGAV